MTTEQTIQGEAGLMDEHVDGVVIYCDGSFRRQRGGWGLHLYGYNTTALTRSIGIKQLPTKQGYIKSELTDTVTPVFYYDSWGHLGREATNNTAELKAMIQSFKLIHDRHWENVLIFTDSEYVRKGLTQWIKNWIKNDWVSSTGKDVANKELWLELIDAQNTLLELGIKPKVEWTKGHANHPGNDAADLAARSGSGTEGVFFAYVSHPDGYHKPKIDASDLILKKWLVFDVGAHEESDDGFSYYHFFTLNSNNSYGKKKEDSLRTKHSKTATLFGRRMSDATFVIFRNKEPEPHLETLKELHRHHFKRDITELGLICLEVGLKPAVYENIRKFGTNYLTVAHSNNTLTTPGDELVSLTITPPKMALDGAQLFNQLEERMRNVLEGVDKKGVHVHDVTETFFTKEEKGNKVKVKLHSDITQTITHLMIPSVFNGHDINIRALMGIDLPTRNALSRMAEVNPTVRLIVVAESPTCYQFAFIFTTDIGDVYYQSPYVRFLIPNPK